METVDDEIRDLALEFMDKAKAESKPFFVWLNPTRMHIVTHLSPKYEAMRNSENGWSEEEAGMAQFDDDVGLVMQKLKDMGVDDNTIVLFTTDNGTEVFTWPDGGQTPFAQSKGTVLRAASACPRSFAGPAMCRRTPYRTAFSPAWTGSHVSCRSRQSEHHRRLLKGKHRRPDLQEPSGRL